MNRKKAVIINDTRRDIGHLGCETVMGNLVALLSRAGIEATTFRSTSCAEAPSFRKAIEEADCLILNGEGTMHHDKPNAFHLMRAASFAKRAGLPCYLVNSIWQDNHILSCSAGIFDRIYVRDGRSKKALAAAGFAADVVPDLSLYRLPPFVRPRADHERVIVTDSVLPEAESLLRETAALMGASYLRMKPRNVFRGASRLPPLLRRVLCGKTLSEGDLTGPVVSGRFHAVCLAMKFGLPFFAIESNTYKVQAIIEDTGLDPRQFMASYPASADELSSRAKSLFSAWPSSAADAVERYVSRAQTLIDDMIANIATSIGAVAPKD